MTTPSSMRCIGCGYDLRNLHSQTCLECGRAFDPNDPATFADHQASGLNAAAFALMGFVLTASAPLAGWVNYLLGMESVGGLAVMLPFASVAGIVVSSIAMGQGIQSWRHSRWAKHRWGFIVAAILGALGSVGVAVAIVVGVVLVMLLG